MGAAPTSASSPRPLHRAGAPVRDAAGHGRRLCIVKDRDTSEERFAVSPTMPSGLGLYLSSLLAKEFT
jgi:hypothetical protein